MTFRLGMLTPSSNTVLEPLTATMLAETPAITAHFARLRVVAINLGDASRAQFDPAPMVAAARLLADAEVHSIVWNGTSGAWLGIAQDRAICAAITAATGIPATTTTLALLDALALLQVRRLALVTPYLAEVQAAIMSQFAELGFDCVAEGHLEDPGNYSFAAHDEARIAAMVRAVVPAGPQAIAIHCTNFRGGRPAAALEAECGVPVLDSVAVSLWAGLRAAGADPGALRRWGRIFEVGRP
jgi:maleate isomerase